MSQNDNFGQLTGDSKIFYDFHGVQLLGMDFPPRNALLEELRNKLTSQTFDAGDYFEALDDQSQESYVVKAKKPIKAFSQVFLIDHCLSFKYNELHEYLNKNPLVLSRLENMLKYWKNKKSLAGYESMKSQHFDQDEFDNMEIEDPSSFDIKQNCQTLSFYGNKIKDQDLVAKLLSKLPNLSAIWFNDNPLTNNEESLNKFISMVESEYPQIELLNSNFTKNCGSWAFKFVTFDNDLNKVTETSSKTIRHLNLSGRGIFRVNQLSQKLQQGFPKLRSLDISDTPLNDLEETNSFFSVLKECQIKYLQCDIQIEHILWELQQNGKLEGITTTLRLVNGRDLKISNPTTQMTQSIQDVKKQILRISGCYRLLSSEQMDEQSIWYVMDEFGTYVQHSDQPNVKIMPLLYLPNGIIDDQAISYSLLWPIRDLQEGDAIYRNFLVGIDETKFRSYRLSVWFNIPTENLSLAYRQYRENLEVLQKSGIEILNKDYSSPSNSSFVKVEDGKKVKLLTDNDLLQTYLTLPYIEFTKELDECDIIFCNQSLQDDLNKFLNKWINQFPQETSIVSKDNLALNIQQSLGIVPWLQDTYNLQRQLPLFMGAFKARELQRKENTWIIKPPNMARSMDMVVTNNLDIIIRLLETGPKLAQKYIHQPLTLRNKKIDFRYVVLLRSIEPLEVFMYKAFFIRSSNIDYSMDENTYTQYENHFTVMNYGQNLTQIHYNEFIQEFEEENPKKKWSDIHQQIVQMVKELFIAVKYQKPQMHSVKSRAVYGMDVMISLPNFQPKLLEMTFSPDCNRACKFHPTFYNDIFECLYFGKENDNIERII